MRYKSTERRTMMHLQLIHPVTMAPLSPTPSWRPGGSIPLMSQKFPRHRGRTHRNLWLLASSAWASFWACLAYIGTQLQMQMYRTDDTGCVSSHLRPARPDFSASLVVPVNASWFSTSEPRQKTGPTVKYPRHLRIRWTYSRSGIRSNGWWRDCVKSGLHASLRCLRDGDQSFVARGIQIRTD